MCTIVVYDATKTDEPSASLLDWIEIFYTQFIDLFAIFAVVFYVKLVSLLKNKPSYSIFRVLISFSKLIYGIDGGCGPIM